MPSSFSDGTSQASRLRPELDPAFAPLDQRTSADLLAFARAYAGELVYVDDNDDARGDWQGLFPSADALVEAAEFLRSPERFSAERAALYARPHFALLLAFVDLLGGARAQLNGLTRRHLEFFYRDVLRMVRKKAVADRLHVLVVPDGRSARLRLPAGTALRAGKDGAGRERIFRTAADMTASAIRLAELRSLRVDIRSTDIRQASRQYLVSGSRKQAVVAMMRITLGDPLPGDALPVPLIPGLLPAAPVDGATAVVDFETLAQADDIVAFVEVGLGWPLLDDFRNLMRLWRSRQAGDERDWRRINKLLQAAGQRRDARFKLPPAPPDDFHANLRAALGMTPEKYAKLYDHLTEVSSIEDVERLLDQRKDVQVFVRDELFMPLDDFRALMQVKLRVDSEWQEIARLIDAGSRRIDPKRGLTAKQRNTRNVEALLAAAYAPPPTWPVPGGLAGLHDAFVAIERYFCMSAEAYHYVMGVAQRSLKWPPTAAADTPARDAQWARVHAICADAHEALTYRRRREALQRAAAPGLAAANASQAMSDMLALALGEPVALAGGLQRLGPLGVGAADAAWLSALSADGARAPATDWARAAELLEVAQRNLEAFVVTAPEQRRWHHLYPATDARAVRVPGQADDAAAPRWLPFGSSAAAAVRDAPPAEALGWAVASPLLALAEGARSVQLLLGLDGDPARFDAEALRKLLSPPDGVANPASANPFSVTLSGAEGWVEPATVQLSWLQPAMGGYPTVPNVDTAALRALVLRVTLTEQQPAIVAASAALHGLDAPLPVMRLMLRTRWDEALDCHHSAYQALSRLRLLRWRLAVNVRGLASLALRNDGGVLDPKKPFEPFGLSPVSGARLSIGHAELVGKALDSISFRGQWMGGPASLADHYLRYDGSPKADSFTLRFGLRDGVGFSTSPALLGLFGGADSAGPVQLTPTLPVDTGRLLTEVPATDDVAGWRRCWVWELAGDLQHAVYPARALRMSMAMATKVANKEVLKEDAYLVNPPYTPKLKSLLVDYSASAEQAAVAGAPLRNGGLLLHIHPFGHEALLPAIASPTVVAGQADTLTTVAAGWLPGVAVPLLPSYEAEGELYLGLSGVQAPQRLSLLVQVAEGSADPDLPEEPVRWSVLSGNRWLSLQEGPLEGSLLADGTRGLINAGIVELQLPAVAPSTLLPGAVGTLTSPTARYWLRLQRQRAIAGVCDMVALHPHAVLALREQAGLAADDLSRPLPPGLVTNTVEPVAGLAALRQPYSSFGGRSTEQESHFNTRVAERLRHRQRALTAWDYEHLVLEQFPQLYKVKCLPAGAAGSTPGLVELVVVPAIANRFPFDPLAPKAPADLIRDIEAFLADKTPAFAKVRVKNPHFVALKVRCGVRFRPGADEGWCRAQLGAELNRFLSPWAHDDGADLVIGGSIYANSIINFLEQREYVDYIAGLRLFTGEEGRFTLVPEGPGYHASAGRADAVLVAAASHEFDVIALTDYRVQAFGGVGNMRIEFDFSVA